MVVSGSTWALDSEGTLTISGAGEMTNYSNYSYNSSPWDNICKNIKKVKIKDGVTSIGDYSFLSCYNLTNVTSPVHYKKTEFKNQRKYKAFTPAHKKTISAVMLIWSFILSSIAFPLSLLYKLF